jgi:hypothetical protein
MNSLPSIVSLLLVLSACGDDGSTSDASSDTSVSVDSASDAPPPDATTDAPPADTAVDAAVCADAEDGMPCTTPGVFCGGPCTDVCSFCNILRCEDGMWGRMEVFPAPCFSCGDSESCQTSVEYCQHTISGVKGGADTYACVEGTGDCEDAVTCECLAAEGVAGDCEEPSPGEATVTLAAP